MTACNHARLCYPQVSVETATGGFSSPNHDGGQPPPWRYFFVRTPSRALFNGRALVGSLRARRCHRAGLLTRLVPAPPFSSGRRASKLTMEAAMPNIPAHPEQSNFSRLAGQVAALTDLMFGDGAEAFCLLTDELQAEVRHD